MDNATIKKLGLVAAGVVVLAFLLNNLAMVGSFFTFLWGLVFPFVLGFIFAFVINLPMRFIEKKLFRNRGGRARRPVSFIVSLLLILAIIALVVFLVVPQLWKTLVQLGNQMPGYIANLEKSLQPLWEYLPQVESWLDSLNLDWKNMLSGLTEMLSSGAGNFLSSAVGVATSIVSGTVSFFIAVIFACYLLLDKEHLTAQLQGLLKAYMPEKRYDKLVDLGRLTYFNYASFVSSQCIEALVLTVLYLLIMTIGGFDYALLVSVFIGFTSLIPMIGAWLGGALGVILLLASMGFWRALAFVIIMVVVQQIDGNLIYPHIVGHGMGLPAVWILVAVMVGGGLAGIFGMLFFIPLFSVLYTLLHKDAKARLAKKGILSPVVEMAGDKPVKKRRSAFFKGRKNAGKFDNKSKSNGGEIPDPPAAGGEEAVGAPGNGPDEHSD